MLDKLVEVLVSLWHWVMPVTVIGEEELAFVRRLGKYHRAAPPGAVWMLPLVEHVCRVDGRLQVLDLPPQSFGPTTVSASFRVRIVDARLYWASLADGWSELESAFAGIVGELAEADAIDAKTLRRRAKAFAKGCGVEVEAATFRDNCNATPVRVFGVHHLG